MAFVLVALVGCSSSHGSDDAAGTGGSAAAGAPQGGTGAAGGGLVAGGPGAGGSAAGKAGSGNAGGAGAGGGAGAVGPGPVGPETCSSITLGDSVEAFYEPPDMTNAMVAGTTSNGTEVLLALNVARSVRLVAVDTAGASRELLNETEYKKTWPFDPTEVYAIETADGVDVLVSDNATAALVHKASGAATVIGLGDTSYMDLHVLGFAPTPLGLLAFTSEGDTKQTLSVLNVDTMQTTTRDFAGPAGFLVVPYARGAWLVAERLDFATDCKDSGKTVDCGGGEAPVPSYDCTWHLDAWNVTDASVIPQGAWSTIDVPATISPRCSDDTPPGLATYSSAVGYGFGVGAHAIAAVDPRTQALMLAIQDPSTVTAGVRFERIQLTGASDIPGLKTELFATNALTWMAELGGAVFACADYRCARADVVAAESFRLPLGSTGDVGVRATLRQPNGLLLIGDYNGATIWKQTLTCVP